MAARLDTSTGLRKAYHRFARRLNYAPMPGGDFDFLSPILAENPQAKVLVIGAGERQYSCDATYTDVAFARNISCICDSHDIPYPTNPSTPVIADSVLEHVCDPQRCVAEYTRVLKPGGFVYAITPFLQPGHLGAYDFTRFTHLGHRRLFRQFDEVASGRSGGPVYAAIHLFREQLSVPDGPPPFAVAAALVRAAWSPIRCGIWTRSFPGRRNPTTAGCAFYFLGTQTRNTNCGSRNHQACFGAAELTISGMRTIVRKLSKFGPDQSRRHNKAEFTDIASQL